MTKLESGISVPRHLKCANDSHTRKGDSCPCYCLLKKGHKGKHQCYCKERWN